jgi:hypothetical protein
MGRRSPAIMQKFSSSLSYLKGSKREIIPNSWAKLKSTGKLSYDSLLSS